MVLPEKLKGGAAKATVSKLLSLGLVQEMPVTAGEPHWRTDESGRPIGLRITRAGLLAIGIEPDEEAGEGHEAGPEDAARSDIPSPRPARSGEGSGPAGAWVPREGSKQVLVLSLLSRPEGATIDDLLSATGWLPHTTRAALTGLRKRATSSSGARTRRTRPSTRPQLQRSPRVSRPHPKRKRSASGLVD